MTRDSITPAMPKWLHSAGKMLLVAMLIVSMGGHLALVQTVAWGTMLMDFSSKEASFSEAVGKTFDGEHPCELCKVVKKSKESEDKKPILKAEMKMDITLPAPVRVPFPKSTEVVLLARAFTADFTEVYLAVPMQPPRAA
jgi:hypothetical protein